MAFLKVGDVDISKYCSEGNLSIDREAVYDSESEFTNVYGQPVKELVGHSVNIGLNFVGMASSDAAALETAAAVGSVAVEYEAPNRGSGIFRCPSLKFTVEDIVAGETYYSGSIALVCDLMPCDGL